MITPIQAVVFDLGRVLVDVDFRGGLFRWLGRATGKDPQALREEGMQSGVYHQFGRGQIGRRRFFELVSLHYDIRLTEPEFTEIHCDMFAPLAGMPELFQEVRARWPVGLLSDTDAIHWEYLKEHYPFLGQIHKPTLSFEIGALKPDPVCYVAAARNVGCSPATCLFVDDLVGNVEGAQQVGMPAILFQGVAALRGELVLRNLLH